MNAAQFPPGPKFALGAALAYYSDPLNYLFRLTRRYGDLVHLQLARDHHFVVASPDYVKAVLLADESEMNLFGRGLLGSQGELHSAQRRLIQPSFNKPQVAAYAGIVARYAERLRDRWRPGQVFDIAEEMMSLTMAIIVKVLFSVDVENDGRDIARHLETIVAMTHRRRVPFHSKKKLARAQAHLDAFVFGLIAQRRKSGQEQPDFLSALLNMPLPEDWTQQRRDQQVRDEAMTMFVAGHETVASSMSWTWYLLSQNPEAEARMHQELDSMLGGRTPAVDDLFRLTYTGMVIAESMRLYPPVWTMTRRTMKDCALELNVPPHFPGAGCSCSPLRTGCGLYLEPAQNNDTATNFAPSTQPVIPSRSSALVFSVPFSGTRAAQPGAGCTCSPQRNKSGCTYNPVRTLHRQRLRLLTRVPGQALLVQIDAQLLGAASAELIFRQHAQNSFANHPIGAVGAHSLGRNFFQAAGIPAVAPVDFVLKFIAGEANLVGVDDHDVIAAIEIRRKAGLVLADQNARDLGGDPAEHLPSGVHDHPIAPLHEGLCLAALGYIGTHLLSDTLPHLYRWRQTPRIEAGTGKVNARRAVGSGSVCAPASTCHSERSGRTSFFVPPCGTSGRVVEESLFACPDRPSDKLSHYPAMGDGPIVCCCESR